MMLAGLYVMTLITGYLLSALLGFIGLSRRRLLAQRGLSGAAAVLLAAAVGRGVARGVPADLVALSLGEDRARTGAHLAAGDASTELPNSP